MNLKYYLRGLGLGIVVTALILTIAGPRKTTMSDAQVKARAKELGMIENTVLTPVENVEEETSKPVSEEVTGEVEQDQVEESKEELQEIDKKELPTETEPKEATKEETTKEEATNKGTAEIKDDPEAPGKKANADEADEGQPVDTKTKAEETAKTEEQEPDKPGKEDTSKADENGNTEETPPAEAGKVEDEKPAPATENQELILTIVGGDSSYTVAKKLYELGLVPSVEQTDKYLCANGYDRTIRTGVYKLHPDDTLDTIAKMINGKPY